jgi:hypothetical protein
MPERPFGNTRQICGSRSPLRCATARTVSIVRTHFGFGGHGDDGGGGWRHCASGGPPV